MWRIVGPHFSKWGPQTGGISIPQLLIRNAEFQACQVLLSQGLIFTRSLGWFMVEKHRFSKFLKTAQLIWCKRYF